ncbi:MAG: sigma factor-like helix-turn-helix DNA-binding protein [Acidimicrobiia bacterium]
MEGFAGRAWQEVSRALVEYGFTVMRAWVVTGQVFVRLREKGREVSEPPPGGIPRGEAIALAEDTVANAIVHFRDKVLKKGYWDPSRGASLTTFFIGNCLMFQFPNLYRSWRSDYFRTRRNEPIYGEDGDMEHPAIRRLAGSDPAGMVVEADQSRRKIASILEPVGDETNRAILLLRAEGFGIDEIAETLGLEYDAVESRIYRARKKLRGRMGA